MGWGEQAGFAEALSQAVGLRVDRIARNADGAHASREDLQREAGRLDGKKVVLWQFAARELSLGDWKVLPLPADGAAGADTVSVEDAIELEGTIASVAPVPPLTRTPYRQAVMEVHLTGVRSAAVGVPAEVVLLGMGVKDRVPAAMTKWKAGERLKVKVVPWRAVQERYGRLHRFALDDPEFKLIEAERWWILEEL
jgi:alginate O-acetyltransferase complex protein AlgJ